MLDIISFPTSMSADVTGPTGISLLGVTQRQRYSFQPTHTLAIDYTEQKRMQKHVQK